MIEVDWKSSDVDKIVPALLKAEMGTVVKNSTNPHFKNRYADLNAVLDVIQPALRAVGILILQPTGRGNEAATVAKVTTVFLHESGQWLSCDVYLPLAKSDPQGMGSAISYGRRYGLLALAGLAAEDDDGNAAVHHAKPIAPVLVRSAPAPKHESIPTTTVVDDDVVDLWRMRFFDASTRKAVESLAKECKDEVTDRATLLAISTFVNDAKSRVGDK